MAQTFDLSTCQHKRYKIQKHANKNDSNNNRSNDDKSNDNKYNDRKQHIVLPLQYCVLFDNICQHIVIFCEEHKHVTTTNQNLQITTEQKNLYLKILNFLRKLYINSRRVNFIMDLPMTSFVSMFIYLHKLRQYADHRQNTTIFCAETVFELIMCALYIALKVNEDEYQCCAYNLAALVNFNAQIILKSERDFFQYINYDTIITHRHYRHYMLSLFE